MTNKTVIVTPYFEDIAYEQFCKELASVHGTDFQLIVVDDGSLRMTLTAKEIIAQDLKAKILRLQRNVGHQCAIAVGLAYACENLTFSNLVIMDSDGEDRPKDIQILLDHLTNSDNSIDIVVAERTTRHETFRFKIFYVIYKLLFKILVGINISFGNFMAVNKTAAIRLAKSQETQSHIAASALKSKLSIAKLPIARGQRYAGQSKMNLVGLTLHGLSSVMVFAENVLVRITLFCAALAASIIFALAVMVVLKIAGLTIAGWFSTVSGILLLLLVQIAIMALLVLLLEGKIRATPVNSLDHLALIEEIIDVR